MHHLNLLKRSSMTLLSVLVAVSVKAEPAEIAKQTLTRTSANGLILQSKLAKNAYRQEAYQDSYTEQVPYQDTETYYENVPYQEDEAYTDYETYYSNDYVCENYTDYERQCHNERQCDYSMTVSGDSALSDIISRPRDPGGNPGPAPFPPTPRQIGRAHV